jgi:hypothetical protein
VISVRHAESLLSRGRDWGLDEDSRRVWSRLDSFPIYVVSSRVKRILSARLDLLQGESRCRFALCYVVDELQDGLE